MSEKKKIEVNFKKGPITNGESIKIRKIQFYGKSIGSYIEQNMLKFSETNLDSFISNPISENVYMIGKVNENCFFVKINGDLNVTGDLTIKIKLK